jgi:isoaspartyl peptidase/L-asparaginase-like protein (Ntn-hydrolase superfamily)
MAHAEVEERISKIERRKLRLPGMECRQTWRYRWPDVVRDDVLARLLALNAERFAEEVAQGLHSKGQGKARSVGKVARAGGGKGGAATSTAGTGAPQGRRRGRPPSKAPLPGQADQFDLDL